VYGPRHVSERLINCLNQWRRFATPFEKRPATYLTRLISAAMVLWL
jgi:hypothetical protein